MSFLGAGGLGRNRGLVRRGEGLRWRGLGRGRLDLGVVRRGVRREEELDLGWGMGDIPRQIGSPAFGGVLSGNCGSAAASPARAKRAYLSIVAQDMRKKNGFKVRRNDRLSMSKDRI